MANADPRRRQRFCAGWVRGWSRSRDHARTQPHGRPLSLVVSGGGARTHRRPRERKSRGLRTGLVVFVLILAACSHPAAQQLPPGETSPGAAAPVVPAAPGTFPTSIRIPSIGLNDNQFMQVGLIGPPTRLELEVPPLSSPLLVGWYRVSAVPGDDGPKPSILESHVNGNKMDGGFVKLDSVKVGDTVEVGRSDGQTAVFTVTATNLYVKAEYDKWKAKVFGDVEHPTLRLITCSGDYDKVHHNYLSNRVVSAKLVSLKPTGP